MGDDYSDKSSDSSNCAGITSSSGRLTLVFMMIIAIRVVIAVTVLV